MIGAGIVAWYPFYTQYIFGFDQARDAYESYSIWHDLHLKIQGPVSDLPGIHHGVLWFYLLAVAYAITNNTFFVVGILFYLATLVTIPLAGYVAYRFFANKELSYVTMILYGCSPMFQAFSRWLSNPVMAVYIAPFVILGVYLCIKKPSFLSFFLTGIGFGLLVQSDFAFISCFLTLPFYFLLLKQKRDIRILGIFLGLLVSMSTFVISEIKFHGKTIQTLFSFIFSHSGTSSLADKGQYFSNRFSDLLTHTGIPFPYPLLVLLIFLGILYKWRRLAKDSNDKLGLIILAIWLLNSIVYFIFDVGITRSLFAYAPTFFVVILLISYGVVLLCRKKRYLYLLVGVIVILQLQISYTWVLKKYNPYTAQQQIFYSDAIRVVDYTYLTAGKKPFSLNTVTNPLYINTTWSYLYTFYGKRTYGYVPYWEGKDQQGYLGSLPPLTTITKDQYIIIEPKNVISSMYIDEAVNMKKDSSTIVETKHIGEYTVQYRVAKEQKNETN